MEVLDEASGEIPCLLVPNCGIRVGVARIENAGVYALENGGHFEVEVGDGLGGRLVDRAVEDGVDDSAGVADRDALAGSVPSGVHEVSLGSALLHPLHELLGVLGGMQLEECLSEACREGRGGLGDSALGSRQLCGEA